MNLTAIVEVTENCNLGCTFCLRPSFTPPIMDSGTLTKVINHVIDHSDKRADFVWHGGEPLLAGLDFFSQIPHIQKNYNPRNIIIRNNIQTNAIKLDERFVEFFEREHFSLSTSIQGTQDIHDKTRVTLSGRGTYDKVISNIALLGERPPAIITLTTDVLGKEEEIYHQTKKHVKGMRILEYFPGGLNPSKTLRRLHVIVDRPEPLMPTPQEYAASMIRFYEAWKRDPNPVELKPISEIISSFIVGKSDGCLYSQEACADSVIGVKPSGDFYTCIRGSPDETFLLGHVDTKPLANYKSRSQEAMLTRIGKLMEGDCGTCEYWDYCNGGCPLESWKLYGDLDHKTWYCEGRKTLFAYIWNDLNTSSVSQTKNEL